jgi:hypothetical protein
MNNQYPPQYDIEYPIGCSANVTFNGEELHVVIGFGDDPITSDDTYSPWYHNDEKVFYYLNKEEEEQLHSAVNEEAKGFAVDGEIEIIIDSEFEYIFL